jgi:fatty acid desaturase
MKMEKFIISAILVFALTNYAYGLGSHHHHHGDTNSGGNGATLQDFNTTANGDSVPVSVPEPTTMLLLASGLIGLGAYARRKFKK